MKEVPFFFSHHGHRLFGVFHEPVAPLRSAFVFCHPFGEEKLWTHRAFVTFARELAQRGHAVLRFDYMGNGDSAGEFWASSLTSMRADVRRAIDQVREMTGCERANLLGLRMGASVAALVAAESPDVDRLLLWAPIVDGGRYMQELLRVNLTTQMAVFKEIREDRDALVEAMRRGKTVNVDGYELGFFLYSEISNMRLAATRSAHRGPCLIVQIDRQPRPSPELQQLAACFEHVATLFAEEEPFWKEIARSYQRPASHLLPLSLEWVQQS